MLTKFGYKPNIPAPDYKGEQTLYKDNIGGQARILDYIKKQNQKWIYIAIIASAFLAIALIGLIYMGSLPKTVPMVITVQPWGEANYVGDVSQYDYSNIPVSEESREYYLKEFVKKTHAISSDKDIVIENWEVAFMFISPRGWKQLEKYFQEKAPFEKVGKNKNYVEIETIIKITDLTYQVDWRETLTTMDNSVLEVNGKRGIYTIKLAKPDKKIERENPLGIFITEFNIEDKGEIRK